MPPFSCDCSCLVAMMVQKEVPEMISSSDQSLLKASLSCSSIKMRVNETVVNAPPHSPCVARPDDLLLLLCSQFIKESAQEAS